MNNAAKYKSSTEWIKQAEYDFKTADAMHNSGRYIYCIFMCHLAIEKALKAHYAEANKSNPPKTHNLIYLLSKTKLSLTNEQQDFVEELNDKSVPTRYPDDIKRILKNFRKNDSLKLLNSSRKFLKWLKIQL
jgi:HEPN domain-containing protein